MDVVREWRDTDSDDDGLTDGDECARSAGIGRTTVSDVTLERAYNGADGGGSCPGPAAAAAGRKRPGRVKYGNVKLTKSASLTVPAGTTIEHADGEDIVLRKRPGRTKYSDVTLRSDGEDIILRKRPGRRCFVDQTYKDVIVNRAQLRYTGYRVAYAGETEEVFIPNHKG